MSTADQRNPPPGSKRPSRFGPTAIIREATPSEDTHLLPLFAEHAEAVERRQSLRFPAVEHRAWLGWWTAPERFATVNAHLDNISLGGARLVLADPPPVLQIVWLCMGIPDPTECVQAKVLEVKPTPEGVSIIRLAFGAPCSQNLYRVAVYGLAGRRLSGS